MGRRASARCAVWPRNDTTRIWISEPEISAYAATASWQPTSRSSQHVVRGEVVLNDQITPASVETIRLRFGRASEQVFTWLQLPFRTLQAGVWLNSLGSY